MLSIAGYSLRRDDSRSYTHHCWPEGELSINVCILLTDSVKVHGTWNLHELLPKDLDFFVMLSSLAGVMGNESSSPHAITSHKDAGHRGQGNYGAGNIFQDYFASYRRSQGLNAMTIDISYLLSVGFVAVNDQYVDHIKSMGEYLNFHRHPYLILTLPQV